MGVGEAVIRLSHGFQRWVLSLFSHILSQPWWAYDFFDHRFPLQSTVLSLEHALFADGSANGEAELIGSFPMAENGRNRKPAWLHETVPHEPVELSFQIHMQFDRMSYLLFSCEIGWPTIWNRCLTDQAVLIVSCHTIRIIASLTIHTARASTEQSFEHHGFTPICC